MVMVLLLLVLQLVRGWGVLLEGPGRRGLVERVVGVKGTVVRVGGSGREVDGMRVIVHEGPDGRQLVLAFCRWSLFMAVLFVLAFSLLLFLFDRGEREGGQRGSVGERVLRGKVGEQTRGGERVTL